MFASLIGKKARMTARTGKDGFADVFARRYTLSVMSTEDATVTFGVQSVDMVPSGYVAVGTELTHEIVTVATGDDMGDVLRSAVRSADGRFFAANPAAVLR